MNGESIPPHTRCVSITLEIVQTGTANRKYSQWKHVSLANTPVYHRIVSPLT